MKKYGLTDSDLNILENAFLKYPQIQKVIIFGSRALGNFKSGSDIDLAIIGNQISSITTEISSYLEQECPIPYSFDLVDYDRISNSNLKKHIDEKGIILYKKNG